MTLLIVIHVILCIFLMIFVLLQPGKADGAVGFGSSSQSIFGSKGAGNFLTKTTSLLGTGFFLTGFLISFPKCSGKKETDMTPVATPAPITSPSTSPAPAASATPEASPAAKAPEAPKK